MNKRQLIKQIAVEADIPQAKAAAALESTVNLIIGAVVDGDKVQIPGFGTFQAKKREARQGRNPRTGEVVEVPASKAPVFRAGKAFKDACKE